MIIPEVFLYSVFFLLAVALTYVLVEGFIAASRFLVGLDLNTTLIIPGLNFVNASSAQVQNVTDIFQGMPSDPTFTGWNLIATIFLVLS